MAGKAYPKATVKKIIKAHSNHNIKKNADVTVRSSRRVEDVNTDNIADFLELCAFYGNVSFNSS